VWTCISANNWKAIRDTGGSDDEIHRMLVLFLALLLAYLIFNKTKKRKLK